MVLGIRRRTPTRLTGVAYYVLIATTRRGSYLLTALPAPI